MNALKVMSLSGAAMQSLSMALADGEGTLGEVAGVVRDTAASAASTFGVAGQVLYTGDADTTQAATAAASAVGDAVKAALADGSITVGEVVNLAGSVVVEVLKATGLDDKVVVQA